MLPRVEERIALEEVAAALRAAEAAGIAARPAVIVHDLGRMRGRIAALQAAFPAGTLHALSIKANPLVEVLRSAVAAGAGLEAASIEEVHLALAAGCPPGQVVYDGPAKTVGELAEALALGVRINADNLAELGRVAALLAGGSPRAPIGLRINPQVGAGSIALTSVADRGSRFGVPAAEEPAIVAAFARHGWLRGLHAHVGSQGCPIDQLAAGARVLDGLRARIDAALGPGRVAVVDIGGGLPAAYRADERAPDIAAHAAALRSAAPGLWTGALQVVTEFGRWVQASCGAAVSEVEVVKDEGATVTAVLHLGADFLLRRVYQPEVWHHEFAVLGPDGAPKQGPLRPTTLAGPLCFAGDVLARALPLPPVAPGDRVVIRDVGAYTLSMWSRYCSRAMPPVLGLEGGALRVLRARETAAEVVAFWSARG